MYVLLKRTVKLFLPYLSETYFEVSVSLIITIEQLADVERDDGSETPSVCRMNVMSSQNTWPIHKFLNTTVDALLLMQYVAICRICSTAYAFFYSDLPCIRHRPKKDKKYKRVNSHIRLIFKVIILLRYSIRFFRE